MLESAMTVKRTIAEPLVSVVIIFLNEEKFLAEAISSVFAQSYTNWELLLVDDGSTDRSSEIARLYVDRYPGRVKYLQHKGHSNQGTGASRNLGLHHSRGNYIAFLDADDVWLSNKLNRQVKIMDSQPEAAMLYGSPQLWYSWAGTHDDAHRDCLQVIAVEPNTLIRPPTLLALFLGRKAITPAPSDVLLRRATVDRIGGFEDDFRGLYEDQVFFCKVCLEMSVFVSGECWVRHRQHSNSACSVGKITGEYYSGHLVFLNWMNSYLSRRGLQRTELWKILQQQLRPYRYPLLFRSMRYVKHLTTLIKDRGVWFASKV